MFRVVPYDTQTGVPLKPFVDTEAWSFTSSITAPGQGSFIIPLRAGAATAQQRAVNRRLISGWETTYTVESNPAPAFKSVWTVEYAGVVVDHTWNANRGSVTVQTLEIEKILELRPLWGTLGAGSSMRAVMELSGVTLGDVIREVLWWAIASPRNDTSWPLPVDVGDLRHGSIQRPEWRYHMRPSSEIIDEIAGEDSAPDWTLRPHIESGRLRWKLEIGSPYLQSDPIRLPVAAPGSQVQSQVIDLSIKTDYQSERTGMLAIGAGSEVDMRVGDAGPGEVPAVRSSLPALIGTTSHKSIDNVAQLDALARGDLAATAGGIEQWSYSVQTGWEERIKPGDLYKGLTVLLDHPGDELMNPGRRAHYILSASLDHTMRYRIESQGVA